MKYYLIVSVILLAGSSFAQAPFSCLLIDAEGPERPWGKCYGDLNIGCGKAMVPATFFTGLIDDVRIYNRVVRP